MKKIIVRIDDVCPDMNYENFAKLRDMLLSAHIKPLIGVVPNNKDNKLINARVESVFKPDKEIWDEIKLLQNEYGWNIALHGYEHIKKTNKSGIIGVNAKSEFAGVSYREQEQSIEMGKKILRAKGFVITSFMAPSHSFDYNTIAALKKNGIKVITDGKGVFPYKLRECIMMPVVQASIYWRLPFGIYTICLHPNTMKEKDFNKLRGFIEKEKNSIVSFLDGMEYYLSHKNVTMEIINPLSNLIMKIGLTLAKVINLLRHKKNE